MIQVWLPELPPSKLSTLGFYLTAVGWLIMGITFNSSGLPQVMPGAYLHPNAANILGMFIFAPGIALSFLAFKRGRLVGPALAFSFLWSIICTLMRQAGMLTGFPVH
jgi:hypothetical protein